MRIAILHTRLSGYLAACLRELKVSRGAELLLYVWPQQADAPFDASLFADLGEIRNRREHTEANIESTVRAFRPDVILTSGWVDRGYVKVCRALRKQGIPVVAGCDTQWTGSLRQQVASLTAPWHVKKAIDVLWVTGERQAVLARALGYTGNRLWDGYYSCDWARFAAAPPAHEPRTKDCAEGAKDAAKAQDQGPGVAQMAMPGLATHEEQSTKHQAQSTKASALPHFLYVGRYVAEKGLDTLAAAYRHYREMVDEPWDLVCAGAGPLRETLVAAGACERGFVQPDALPDLMAEASAFILPSRFEPWGVVVQEAAAAGLPLICSDACGAGVHLLRDQFNGFLFPAGNPIALADRMVRMTVVEKSRREGFGRASFELSKQYTPTRWVETLVVGLENLNER